MRPRARVKRWIGIALAACLLATMASAGAAQADGASGRIVGGDEAPSGKWPAQVAVTRFGGLLCGGTLISPHWVLTSATCVAWIPQETLPSSIEVRTTAGRLTEPVEQIGANEVVIHPLYDPSNFNYDVALIRLSAPSTMPPMPLIGADDQDLYAEGVLAVATGWGTTLEPVPVDRDVLREVTLPIISDRWCRAAYPKNPALGFPEIGDLWICAGNLLRGGIDTCSGDGGGPLLVPNREGDGYVVAGITSWGSGCAEPLHPGVYTEVASMLPFLEATMARGLPVRVGGLADGFSPPVVEVAAGDSVEWNWVLGIHSVVSVDGAFDSELHNTAAEPAYSFSVTFTEPGEYFYYDGRHATAGDATDEGIAQGKAVGKVIVNGPQE